jgi:hypothetical protein
MMGKSGRWIGAELAQEHGVIDNDGRQPPSPRAFRQTTLALRG